MLNFYYENSYIYLENITYHYIFDIKVYETLINKNYERIHFSSYSSDFSFLEKLSSEKLAENREKAEKILYKVALLNLQYVILNMHFCLCIIEDDETLEYAFKLCLYKVEGSPISIIDLSNLNIDLMADSCFENCINLESIMLPNSIIKIEKSCFKNCTNLKSITIPNSVTEVGDCCFYKCVNLESIIIPNSVTKIGNYCFDSCTKLESITLSNSVTELCSSCFNLCKNLRSILLPNSIIKLGDSCFNSCSKMQSITLPNILTKLGYLCFQGCINLRELIIPKGMKIEPRQIGLTARTKIKSI